MKTGRSKKGAPNDRMLPNTPEVSQMVFSMLKTIYLFGCVRGTLVVTKVLGGFSSHPKVLTTRTGREYEDIK